MPLPLEIKKEMTARSDRVKSVDVYPEEHPWVLAALYNGNVCIYDYTIWSLHTLSSLAVHTCINCNNFLLCSR